MSGPTDIILGSLSSFKKPRVIISLTGGLGNQFFQLAAAVNLSEGGPVAMEWDLGQPRLNKSGLPDIVDFFWPDFVTLLPSKSPRVMTRKAFSISRRINISSKKYRDMPGMSVLSFITSILISLYLRMYISYEAARGVGYQEIVLRTKTTFLTGYFQSYLWSIEKPTREIFMNTYLKNPSIEFRNLESEARITNPIMLHVRLGDYKNETTFGIPNTNYYKKAIEEISTSIPEREIWVFSNELELAETHLPNQFAHRYRYIKDEGLTPAEILELMRNGCGYIIGNSTFSWWSAFLSYQQSSPVVCPDPWFQIQESPIEIIPPQWHKLPAWD